MLDVRRSTPVSTCLSAHRKSHDIIRLDSTRLSIGTPVRLFFFVRLFFLFDCFFGGPQRALSPFSRSRRWQRSTTALNPRERTMSERPVGKTSAEKSEWMPGATCHPGIERWHKAQCGTTGRGRNAAELQLSKMIGWEDGVARPTPRAAR